MNNTNNNVLCRPHNYQSLKREIYHGLYSYILIYTYDVVTVTYIVSFFFLLLLPKFNITTTNYGNNNTNHHHHHHRHPK